MGLERFPAGLIGLRSASATVDAMLGAQVRPPADGRTAIVGPEPIRVLVVGAGTAVGYGVRTRAEAFDGRLAAALAERTGRGVIVETRVRRDLRLQDTVDLLGATGALTFHAVVWSPTFQEVVRFQPLRAWVGGLQRILAHLRSTGTVDTGVVLLGFPDLTTRTRAGALAVARQRRVDERIAAAAERASGVRYARPPALGPIDGELWTPAYYERCAAAVLPALLEVLPSSVGRLV